VEITEYVAALDRAGRRLADSAERVGLTAEVPRCPGWQVRDVVAHTGGVHRWAGSFVITGRAEPYRPEEEAAFFAAPEDGLVAWFRAGHAELVEALRTADPDLACWSFLPAPSPVAFWARRQLHETTIHSIDAGTTEPIDQRLARDGIDELLTGFFSRRRKRHADDPPLLLRLRTTDTDDDWTVRARAGVCDVTSDGTPAPVTVAGTAAELYLLLWNRREPDDLEVSGDQSILDQWRSRMKVTWS
jgi:uncharacterized protein (TIGR03083 family)